MALIVMTYYFTTTGKWGPHTKRDEVCNIIGSILVGVSVYHIGAWPAFTLQVVWAAVALWSLTQKVKTA